MWEASQAQLAAKEARLSEASSSSRTSAAGGEPLTLFWMSPEVLASVRPAGCVRSLQYFAVRAVTQQLRGMDQLLADFMLEAFAGMLVGCLYVHVEFSDLTK
jgi:hypothetical protein